MPDNPLKPELLAPAGTIANFETAVRAGADAVYVGAPGLNARALAKHFSLAELAAMIDYGHRAGVKVYLAMNSLMKEDEIPQAVELLALLEGLRPDALIIQDLGLYSLIKKYFPSLNIHASTLMAAHNSLAVRQFAEMGFSRVVLAREMSLAEINKIHQAHPVELEVFVHGALCFSYSGLCLFSSYCGGKSGLRGRCVQPCRRRYTWTGPGKGHRAGYLFSMNDLNSIELIPQLVKAGVASLKIEGRLRSAQYVDSVVRAYRLVIDSGSDKKALEEARELLKGAMGRKSTTGYFLSPQPVDGISPQHSGNIGLFLGKILHTRGRWATIKVKEKIQVKDRLRLHSEKSGERDSFTLKNMCLGKKSLNRVETGSEISLELPFSHMRPGDSLYKVDVRERGRFAAKSRINPARFRKKIGQIVQRGRVDKILKEFSRPPVRKFHSKGKRPGWVKGKRPGGPGKKNLPLWLKTDDPSQVLQFLSLKPEKIILMLDRTSSDRFRRMKKIRFRRNSLIWALPPIILEYDVEFYRQAMAALISQGYRDWQIGHISQLQLFKSLESKKHGHGLRIYGDYTLNILNSPALAVLKKSGISGVQAAIETDRENVMGMCRNKHGVAVGLTVYGRPPLFTARLESDHFHYDRVFVSPKGERFVLKKKWGQTLALPEQPFSLLAGLDQLAPMGLDYGVIDLSYSRLKKRELDSLFHRQNKGGKRAKTSTFNFYGRLQ